MKCLKTIYLRLFQQQNIHILPKTPFDFPDFFHFSAFKLFFSPTPTQNPCICCYNEPRQIPFYCSALSVLQIEPKQCLQIAVPLYCNLRQAPLGLRSVGKEKKEKKR